MRALVLGGGYAGVTLARKLERRLPEEHDIVVVDDDGRHLVQHELHRVVRRPELAEEITIDLAAVLERASVRVGSVASVTPEDRTVALEDGDVLEYDACAVAIGAAPSQAVEGVAEHGVPLKRLEHARRINERAIDALEEVNAGDGARSSGDDAGSTDGGARNGDENVRFVVGGAGLSGVQVAGELAALVANSGAGDDADSSDGPAVTLLEQADSVAPSFDAPFRAAIRAALDDRGVDVRTGTAVERATTDAVELENGESVAHDLLVWTGGITGPDAMAGERPVVDATLSLGDRTFGLGDAVRAIDRDGEAVPATAQAAVREAETVATNVERVLEGGDAFDPRLERFTFDPPGWVVSVGDGAVAQVGPTVVSGRAAVAMKATVGVGYLSSVGAVREAVDLVNHELGLGVDGG